MNELTGKLVQENRSDPREGLSLECRRKEREKVDGAAGWEQKGGQRC